MSLRGLKGKVSVEPVAFLYLIAMMYSNCLSTNLLLYKACDPTGVIAQRVGSKCDNEALAQHVVAPINGWKALFQHLIPIVLVLFAGTWSDRHGRRRRPLILLPIAGQITADALSLYCVVNWSVSPALTAAMQAAALTFTGGSPMFFNGVNSYVADTTSEEWRTVKYGVVGGTFAAGAVLGMFTYGIVVVNFGFVSAYLVSIGVGMSSMALTFVFIDDVAVAADAEHVTSDKLSLYQDIVRTVNPIEVFRNSYRMLTKRRSGHNTVILCLVVLVCAPLTCVPLEGEMVILYLYLRYKFQWNELDFSIFNAYQMTILLIGTIFALGILSYKCRMNDALIGTIASIFDSLAAVTFLLVSQSWQLFLVPPLELFRGAALSLTSSIASKCVEPGELGAMNSVKLLMEGGMKSGFVPLYSFVYNHTFESMPSAFFFVSIALTAPLVFTFGFIYYLHRKSATSNSFDHYDENGKPNTEISPIHNSDVINYHI